MGDFYMKGVKLLFTALLCLATGGAWAQLTYDLSSSANSKTGDFYGTWTSGTGQYMAADYSYTFQLQDFKTGLVFRCPSLYGENKDTDEDCYVGLMEDYKTGTKKLVNDSVDIPSTITIKYIGTFNQGTASEYTEPVTRTKKVKYIIDEGFTTTANGDIPDADDENADKWGNGYDIYKEYDSNGVIATHRHDRMNPYLKKVTFSPDDDGNYQLLGIGERAFQGCVLLESAMVPPTVTKMGESTFGMCFRMKSFQFLTKSTTVTIDGESQVQETTSLTEVPYNCFYQCNALQSLDIPYGVTKIDDYALQDNWNLKQLTLPNTLTTIGQHFLCRAKSLTSFYIPANVTYIDGACLHGCEKMRDVYLLGTAAYLIAQDDGSSATFGPSPNTYGFYPDCAGVNNCTFHVTSDTYSGYTSYYKSGSTSVTNTWYTVWGGENGVYGKDGATDTYNASSTAIQHNRIIWNEESNPQYTRDFGPYKWQSVIFYNSIDKATFQSTFGTDALAATFTDCYKDSKDSKVYHLGFTTIDLDNNNVPAKTPLMIYIGAETVKGYQMNTDNTETSGWKSFYTQRYNVEQPVDLGSRKSGTYADGETVIMVGLPVPIPMHENEFYFKWVTNSTTDYSQNYGRIRRCVTAGDSYKGRFSCFWQIKKNGALVTDGSASGAKGFVPTDDFNSPTGINNVNAEQPTNYDVNIYDTNGRLVGTSRASLPKGLYIQGGKKFIKK